MQRGGAYRCFMKRLLPVTTGCWRKTASRLKRCSTERNERTGLGIPCPFGECRSFLCSQAGQALENTALVIMEAAGHDAQDSGQRGLFPATRWSVVLRMQNGTEHLRARALEDLCRTYWKPVYGFVRSRGASPQDAEDLTQDFLARLLAGDWLAEVGAGKGRLRSFLLVVLKRFLVNEYEYNGAAKRGGRHIHFSMDAAEGEMAWRDIADPAASPDVLYERQWALQLLAAVMACLRADYVAAGKAALFDVLRAHLTAAGGDDYATDAARLGMSHGAVRVAVHRMRHRYRELLRRELADTVESEALIDDEIRHLFAVFH